MSQYEPAVVAEMLTDAIAAGSSRSVVAWLHAEVEVDWREVAYRLACEAAYAPDPVPAIVFARYDSYIERIKRSA